MLDRYEKVILWGGRRSLDSTRHIYRHFYRALLELDFPSDRLYWVDDAPGHRGLIEPGSLVYVVNVWGEHIGAAVGDVAYVTHNFGPETELVQTVEPQQHLGLQVYTNDSDGEEWDKFRLFHKGWRTLFQPWGTDLLADQFYRPVFNPTARECIFVGAVWDDNGLGNFNVIPKVEEALARRFLLFVNLSQISDQENVDAVRRSRVAPAFAGRWQVEHNYLPCRVFKNVSYGAMALTNVPGFRTLYGDSLIWDTNVEGMVDAALGLSREEYLDRVIAQQDVTRRYTYRESWLAIERALEEIR